MKVHSNKTVSVWFRGTKILLVAIILNIVAEYLGIKTWYTFLQSLMSSMSIIDATFLFVVYPLALGISAK